MASLATAVEHGRTKHRPGRGQCKVNMIFGVMKGKQLVIVQWSSQNGASPEQEFIQTDLKGYPLGAGRRRSR